MSKSYAVSVSFLLIFNLTQFGRASSIIPTKLAQLSSIMDEITEEFNHQSLQRQGWFDNKFDKLFALTSEYTTKLTKTLFFVHAGFYTVTNYNLYHILYEQLGIFKKFEYPKDASI